MTGLGALPPLTGRVTSAGVAPIRTPKHELGGLRKGVNATFAPGFLRPPTDCCPGDDATVHNLDLYTTGCFCGHTLKLPGPHVFRLVGRSAVDHPLNLGHELIQSERFGHDFHTLLHPVIADSYTLGVASKE
jgi:hypothetical protein